MVAIDLTTGGDDLPDGVRAASERVWERDGPGRPGPGRRQKLAYLLLGSYIAAALGRARRGRNPINN